MLPAPEPSDIGLVLAPNLQNFRLRWALKKIARKLHGLSVPNVDCSGEAKEEWMHKSDDHVED